MDKMATAAHSLPPEWLSSQASHILPGEQWAVFHNGVKITSSLRETLLAAFQEEATVRYVQQKYGFTDPIMASVGWHYLECLFRRKSAHQRATLSKYIHGWLPSEAFLRKQGREAPMCPFCQNPPARNTHFLTCMEAKACTAREEAWNACTAYFLKEGGSCPAVVDLFDSKVRPLLNLPPRRRPRGIGRSRDSVQQAIDRAVASQDIIGWDLFCEVLLRLSGKRLKRNLREEGKTFRARTPRHGAPW